VIDTKTNKQIKVMQQGGRLLAEIKEILENKVGPGISAYDLEKLATKLIAKRDGKPSFKMVPGYRWSTCININQGLVHGIPKKNLVFKEGDIVSVDIGLYFKGFHTDTAFTKAIGTKRGIKSFLKTGKLALSEAIQAVKINSRIFDISKAIENTIVKHGYSPIKALVGHGIGKNLHEIPQIPCFISTSRSNSLVIPVGAVLAIEVMYTQGEPEVVVENDGWTISTRDGKMSALFEETVALTANGRIVLTTSDSV
jgi:methionyl aminopeptidase